MALNRHLEGENGSMVLSAALWLASATPDMMDALTEPGASLVMEFVLEGGNRRMKMMVAGPKDGV